MKKIKKYVSLLLVLTLVCFNLSQTFAAVGDFHSSLSNAALDSENNMDILNFDDESFNDIAPNSISPYAAGVPNAAELQLFLASAFMLNDSIDAFEAELGEELVMFSKDFIPENIQFSDEWVDSTNQFIDRFLSENATTMARNDVTLNSSSIPSDGDNAKAAAIMYSIDRAVASVNRKPSRNLEKEAQYMFITHYIDRDEYYWANEDNSFLLDGARMSGERGYLADYVTDGERGTLNGYIGVSNATNMFYNLGKIASSVYEICNSIQDIYKLEDAIENADEVLELAYKMKIGSSGISLVDLLAENIDPLWSDFKLLLENNPEETLESMYSKLMDNSHFMEGYSFEDKSTFLGVFLSIAGSAIISGGAGATTAAGEAMLSIVKDFTLVSYRNFFNYVAWVQLRYTFSGRYADRVGEYYLG